LTATISQLDTDRLAQSWKVMAEEFSQTPPALKIALQGVARFSQTLNDRDAQLRKVLTDAKKMTTVLAERSDAIVKMLADSDALLADLKSQSRALDEISGNISAVSRQMKGVIAENRAMLAPALENLNKILTILDERKERIQLAIKGFNQYAMSLGESMSSGPFFKFYIANLLPGQFIQPFVDAAFSDLGLDPNVLAPSQLTDPQTGQPATPALPMPFPRTGQGGDPRLTLPDAITVIPGDPRYPYTAPSPAPPPGGPPPGPPADPSPVPTPTPGLVPAPLLDRESQ
jgi:phospholipid/cholesterol/gamma-HCH transport system substrate-binding protein